MVLGWPLICNFSYKPIHPMELLQKSNGPCLKRKHADDCLTKHFESDHVEVQNVSSTVERGSFSDPHAHRCLIQPNLANDCVNYLRSTAPSHVVFYKRGSWCNFPEQILPSLVDAFKDGKSSVVVVMEDQPILVDFLSMTLVNLRTKKQRSVAWLDGAGKWFVPSAFFDEEASEPTKSNMNSVEGSTRRTNGDKVAKSPSEALNQVVSENTPPVPQNSCTADILHNMLVSVERGSESFMFVQNLFLSGMGSFATPNSIVQINCYSPKHITAQCRLEAFERQIRLTSERCGAANTRYVWFGSGKKEIVRILMDGFLSIGKTTKDADLDGVYLSPGNRAFASVGLCDVDENGVQYMLLCRAILGNMESNEPGTHEFPSSDVYDSIADNSSNPGCYFIWNSHLSTHICFEYLISFKLAPNVQEYLGQKCLWFHPPPKRGLLDLCALQPINCQATEGPTSPWVSFKVLFATIQGSLSPIARELLFCHYEELKENKITREDMVKKMMLIIGEKMLVDSLAKLDKCSPSQWYKSPAKVATDTINTTVNSICTDTSRLAPSATPGHDYQVPIIMPVKCEPVDSESEGFPLQSVSLTRQEFPRLRVSAQNSSAHCPESSDPSVPVMQQTVHASIPSGAPENTTYVRTDNCYSVGPSLGSNGHAPLTQNSASLRRSSLISRSTLGKSESLGMKDRHSVTLVTSWKAGEPLRTGSLSESSSTPSCKGSDAATASISPRIQSPSMLRQSRATSMAPHLRATSMLPQLRVPSKISQGHVQGVILQPVKKSVMLQAQYSGPITMIPVSSTPSPSGTSSEEPVLHQTPELGTRTEGIDCPAPSMIRKALLGPRI